MLYLRRTAARMMMDTMELVNLPRRLLAGISGGADSVALLHLLLQAGVQVTAVHVNHGLRGCASDGDEGFVRALCDRLKVPLLVFRAEPPEHPGEEWARQTRYAFFREAAARTGMDAIALAHHRDDQAETLLMHLLRGSGLGGLCGMAADSTAGGLRILRPLLSLSRAELRAFLTGMGQSWREDESNADPRYLRNALRSGVLPRLEELIPGAAERLARTAELLRDDEAVLEELTQAFMAVHGGRRHMSLAALRAQPMALRRRIVRAWWQREVPGEYAGRGLSAAQTQALCDLMDAPAGSRCNLPEDWHGQCGWTHLHLLDDSGTVGLAAHGVTESPLLSIELCQGRTGDGRTSQAIPRAALEGLIVRTRRAGDWIRPFGCCGRQPLQDYLVNRRVDAPFRDQVPLVCRGSEVLLAGGVGAGDVARMDDTKHDEYVLLRWNEAFPWQKCTADKEAKS